MLAPNRVQLRISYHPIAVLPLLGLLAPACADDPVEEPPACQFPLDFEIGDDGHPQPLADLGPGVARAGRISAADLPESPDGLAVWAAGDFVLANDRVAMLIEDVGPSDLYDPWGGRPVGITRVVDNRLVEPNNFGEFFVLTGRQSVLTESVTVLADGTDGGPAVIRATGRQLALPFYEAVIGVLLRDDFSDIPAAIDYVLEPDAEHVDIYVRYNSPRLRDARVGVVLHGFMYTKRAPPFTSLLGFDLGTRDVDYVAFVDDDAATYAYSVPGQTMRNGISTSGFASNFTDAFDIAACARTDRHYARIDIGGPGVDGLLEAMARSSGTQLRTVNGVLHHEDGSPAAGVRVHATTAAGEYLTRTTSDELGAFAVHVPTTSAIELTTFRRGLEIVGPIAVGDTEDNIDITIPAPGQISLTTVDDATGLAVPARIQILPVGREVPSVPAAFGEPEITSGRLHVAYALDGSATFDVPQGTWDVVVSRGYEYEIFRATVDVVPGQLQNLAARIERVVDTTDYQCADFHIHTHRSPDSGDDAREKLASGVADGLEIPVRTEHEHVDDFQPLIQELGLEQWAFGVGSVELTSFQVWGHMGVFPLEPDPTRPNGGAPTWQRYPDADNPDVPIETLLPPEVFGQVRARPERPAIIINHPRRSANYFDISGYDPVLGTVERPEYWDEEFQLVEFFNSSSWQQEREDLVLDWLGLLRQGRRVFAVGSSDSHGISSKPIGYPRTCIRVGTDDPRELTAELLRDNTQQGHSIISGGIYVYASVANAGPGDDATGLGPDATLNVRVEAPSWISVDWLEVVMDGQTIELSAITPADADPANPAVRLARDIPIQIPQASASYVIVAAYGDSDLAPVHPGRRAFGVSNPIFVAR